MIITVMPCGMSNWYLRVLLQKCTFFNRFCGTLNLFFLSSVNQNTIVSRAGQSHARKIVRWSYRNQSTPLNVNSKFAKLMKNIEHIHETQRHDIYKFLNWFISSISHSVWKIARYRWVLFSSLAQMTMKLSPKSCKFCRINREIHSVFFGRQICCSAIMTSKSDVKTEKKPIVRTGLWQI